jgi:DNA-binding PadR family transcriptional regulator
LHGDAPPHILGYGYPATRKQVIIMPGKRRRVSNPLALAVLAALRERPMHPYEMAATMRSQGKERSIKLNYGSLYTVVENLAKHGLIEAMEATREGRRPERTVYRLTEAGRAELEDWLVELLGTPVKEYPQFEAALAEIAVLPPAQVCDVLQHRVEALEQAVAAERAEIAQFPWLPRLFLLEIEYHLSIREAELAWVRGLVRELRDGSFPLMKEWDHWTRTGELPEGLPAELYQAVGQTGAEEGTGAQTAGPDGASGGERGR